MTNHGETATVNHAERNYKYVDIISYRKMELFSVRAFFVEMILSYIDYNEKSLYL